MERRSARVIPFPVHAMEGAPAYRDPGRVVNDIKRIGVLLAWLVLALTLSSGLVHRERAELLWTLLVLGAVASAVLFVLLIGRAIERRRGHEVWAERRELRAALRRSEARCALTRGALWDLYEWDRSGPRSPSASWAFLHVADQLGKAFGADRDDYAAVLATRLGGRWRVMKAVVPSPSRWSDVAGCAVYIRQDDALGGVLERPGCHHRSFCVGSPAGAVAVGVASETPLTPSDLELLEETRVLCELLVARWTAHSRRSVTFETGGG